MPLAYVLNPLDRRANDRTDAAWIAAQRDRPDARLIGIAGDSVLMRGAALATENHDLEAPAFFLGLDDGGRPWFARRIPETEGLRDMRSLAMEEALPPAELGILAQARSMIAWHERRTFCSNCAARLETADAGYRRHCPQCGMDHFPRTDPVVIMLAIHGDRCLLGRQKIFPPHMYSALAGFVEPGESLEEAVRREIQEESGVPVGEVRYHSSQPWPFPASLMIGCHALALDDRIELPGDELEEAVWFEKGLIREALLGKHRDRVWMPPPHAIAHQLIKSWASVD